MDATHSDHTYASRHAARNERLQRNGNYGIARLNHSFRHLPISRYSTSFPESSVSRSRFLHTNVPLPTHIPSITTVEVNSLTRYVPLSPIAGVLVETALISAVNVICIPHHHYCIESNAYVSCDGVRRNICPFHTNLGPMGLHQNIHPIIHVSSRVRSLEFGISLSQPFMNNNNQPASTEPFGIHPSESAFENNNEMIQGDVAEEHYNFIEINCTLTGNFRRYTLSI